MYFLSKLYKIRRYSRTFYFFVQSIKSFNLVKYPLYFTLILVYEQTRAVVKYENVIGHKTSIRKEESGVIEPWNPQRMPPALSVNLVVLNTETPR